MRYLMLIAAFLSGLVAPAQASLVTITCDDPEGFLIFHGENILRGPGIHHEAVTAERFGSKPTFILDSKRPDKMIVLWGSYIAEGLAEELIEALDLEAEANEALVVFRDEDQITAIEPYEQGVYTYSLYPKLNYGIYTKSGHWATEEHAVAWIYYGTCSFPE